jgi:hypothetical protein
MPQHPGADPGAPGHLADQFADVHEGRAEQHNRPSGCCDRRPEVLVEMSQEALGGDHMP